MEKMGSKTHLGPKENETDCPEHYVEVWDFFFEFQVKARRENGMKGRVQTRRDTLTTSGEITCQEDVRVPRV